MAVNPSIIKLGKFDWETEISNNWEGIQIPPDKSQQIRQRSGPAVPPDFVHEEIVIREVLSRDGKIKFVHLLEPRDCALFELIEKFLVANPFSPINDCLDMFLHHPRADVLVYLIYDEQSIAPDSVFKFDFNADKDKILNHKVRLEFELQLLKRHLICLWETSPLVDNKDEDGWFIKIYAPFTTLATESERLRLKFPVINRVNHIRNRLKQKNNQKEQARMRRKQKNEQSKPILQNTSLEFVNSSSESESESEESNSRDAIRRRRTHRHALSMSPQFSPSNFDSSNTFESQKNVYSEGSHGTFGSAFRYTFAIVGREFKYDLAPFKKENLMEFVGGSGIKRDVYRNFFSSGAKNNIVWNIVNQCKLTLPGRYRELLADDFFIDFFAIHDSPYKKKTLFDFPSLRQKIFTEMQFDHFSLLSKRSLLAFIPLKEIKEYWGEKIAFYFAWLSFYALWCLIPAILGLLVFGYGVYLAATADISTPIDSTTTIIFGVPLTDVMARSVLVFDNMLTLPFSLFISLWAVLFLEFWRRQLVTLQVLWGVKYLDREACTRPEWKGSHWRTSPITKLKELYSPTWRRISVRVSSFFVLGLGIGFVIFAEVLVIVFQAIYKGDISKSAGIAGIFSLANIVILTPVYRTLAKKMNDLENYRTDVQWENAFIFKEFILTFVINYTPLFFVGLIKSFLTVSWDPRSGGFIPIECNQNSCLIELNIQVIIIFVGVQYLAQIIEIIMIPLSKMYKRLISNFDKTLLINQTTDPHSTPQFLQDEMLEKYNQRFDFSTKVIQFGFLTLFSAAFPLSPLFAFISNIIELRLDCFRLCTQYRRPWSFKTRDIGLWIDLLMFLASVGSITNGMIIAFNSNWFDKNILELFVPAAGLSKSAVETSRLVVKIVFCILFNYTVILLRVFVDFLVPDVPTPIEEYDLHQKYCSQLERGEVFDHDVMDEERIVLTTVRGSNISSFTTR